MRKLAALAAVALSLMAATSGGFGFGHLHFGPPANSWNSFSDGH
jgi:hypothetical protein